MATQHQTSRPLRKDSREKTGWNQHSFSERTLMINNFGDEEDFDELAFYDRLAASPRTAAKSNASARISSTGKSRIASSSSNGYRRVGGGPRG